MVNGVVYNELVNEYGKEKLVLTADEFIDVKAYGTYEIDYNNGELWTYNSSLYLLDISLMPLNEQRNLKDSYTTL